MRLIDADKLIRRMRIDMDRMKYQYNLDVIEGMSLAIVEDRQLMTRMRLSNALNPSKKMALVQEKIVDIANISRPVGMAK